MGRIVKSSNNTAAKPVTKMSYAMFKRSRNHFLREKTDNIGRPCGVLLLLEPGFIEKLYCLKNKFSLIIESNKGWKFKNISIFFKH